MDLAITNLDLAFADLDLAFTNLDLAFDNLDLASADLDLAFADLASIEDLAAAGLAAAIHVKWTISNYSRKLLLNSKPSASTNIILQYLIETAPNLYTLSKIAAYIVAFKQFILAKARKAAFCRSKLDATYLDDSLLDVVKYVQSNYFGAAVDCLKNNSPDEFDSF